MQQEPQLGIALTHILLGFNHMIHFTLGGQLQKETQLLDPALILFVIYVHLMFSSKCTQFNEICSLPQCMKQHYKLS